MQTRRSKAKITKTQKQVENTLLDYTLSTEYEDLVNSEGVAALIYSAAPMRMTWAHRLPRVAPPRVPKGGNGHTVPDAPDPHHHRHHEHTGEERQSRTPPEIVDDPEVQALGDLPGVTAMICPGGDQQCALDMVRVYRVADHVSMRARRRMERVIRRYIRGMNRVARLEGRGKVDLRVRLHLTAQGPRLAFGLKREEEGKTPTSALRL